MHGGASFFGGRHVTQQADWGFWEDTATHNEGQMSDFKLHRGRGHDRSEPDIERKLSRGGNPFFGLYDPRPTDQSNTVRTVVVSDVALDLDRRMDRRKEDLCFGSLHRP